MICKLNCVLAYFVADGRTNRNTGSLRSTAASLRNSGVQVYTVGIGNIAVSQLQDIASDPDDEHVFIFNSFLDIAGFADVLSVITCDGEYCAGYFFPSAFIVYIKNS